MRPEPPRLKRIFIDHMWEWLTPSLIFAVCYAPVSIVIILFAPFHLGNEFATGFCFGSAGMFGCVIIGSLHRGYRKFKRASNEIDRLSRQIDERFVSAVVTTGLKRRGHHIKTHLQALAGPPP